MFCHPILAVILSKLLNLMLSVRYVPRVFKFSYIVPIPKPKDYYSKPLKCDDFRGIAIRPILSKVFEYCLLEKCNYFLKTSDTQFGFKTGLGCNHALCSYRTSLNLSSARGQYCKPLCHWLDLSKAFGKVNLHALFIKLIKRNVPIQLLGLLENTLFDCHSCVKWENVYSDFFTVMFGVCQDSVLAPFLFAVFLDELSDTCNLDRNRFIVVYADDILLISPSVVNLENLIHLCGIKLVRYGNQLQKNLVVYV